MVLKLLVLVAASLGSRIDPPPSAGHALVYHDELGRVLLLNAGLGGMDSPSSSTRTVIWLWNGAEWSVLDSLGPPIRNLGGVAYDSHRDVVVVYGGSYSLDLVYADTWEWSHRDGWKQRDATGPGRRDHTAMAYDWRLRRSVLYGGQARLDSFPADTWTWDGSRWERIAASEPGPRVHHSVVYDLNRGFALLFGGIQPGAGDQGDAWGFTGSQWRRVAVPTAPRSHGRLGASSQGLILYGGMDSPAPMLLRSRDTTWVTMPSGTTPGARYLTAMAYDPLRGVTVLFGGGDPASDRLLADTWEYSAAVGWRRVR